MSELRMNAGYIITDSIHIGESEFVLGCHHKNPNMFVTWRCYGETDYYWGHYITDLNEAKRDLLNRAQEELELYAPSKVDQKHQRDAR